MEVGVGAVLSICAWWSCLPPNKATIIGTSFFLDRVVHSLILDSNPTTVFWWSGIGDLYA